MLVFILLAVPVINATESFIFKQNTISTLEVPVFEYDLSKCSTCTCELTIDYPNGSNMIRSTATTITGHYAIYSLSAVQNSVIGTYKGDLHCTNGVDNGGATFEYIINYSGDELSTSQGLLYIIFFVISLGLFLLTLFGSLKIKWKHHRNEEGKIISLNELKYVKLVLIAVTYLLSIWISFLVMGISRNYLYIDAITNLFNAIFWILLSGFFPIFTVTLVVFVVNFVNDKKLHKALMRGIPVR